MSKYEEKKTNGNYQVVFYKWVRDGPCALGLFTSSQETMSIISKAHQCQIQIFTYWIVLNIVDFKLFRYFLLYTSCKNAPKTCWPKGKVNHRQHKSRSFCWPFVVLWPRDSSSWGWGTSRTQWTSPFQTPPQSPFALSLSPWWPHTLASGRIHPGRYFSWWASCLCATQYILLWCCPPVVIILCHQFWNPLISQMPSTCISIGQCGKTQWDDVSSSEKEACTSFPGSPSPGIGPTPAVPG